MAAYASDDAKYPYEIQKLQEEEFNKRPELYKWFKEIEMPLCNILIKSELKGVKVNVKKLKSLQEKLEIELKDLERELKWIVNKPNLNLSSSKQLQELLYKELKLPKIKKTKTGWSTDVKTLQKLQNTHAFCGGLLRFRELSKLLTAFVIPLQEQADENGKIHAWFNQCGTRTRRMSCRNPNLQQIPSTRSDLGNEVRKCFVPSEGHKFLIADYSQIELRLLAHFSGEPKLVQAYKNGDDVHQQTADFISKKLVSKFDRDKGKLLNFSIIYGKTAHGFSQDWNCSKEEAQAILDSYFDLYPRVREWIKEQQLICQASNGWIKTLAGLPLHIPNINSNKRWEFQEAQRQAVNYLIQGSSQDILKKAMIDIYKKLEFHPVLMVHDELVYEIKDPDGVYVEGEYAPDDVPFIIHYQMKKAWKLNVPLEVDYKISDWWEK